MGGGSAYRIVEASGADAMATVAALFREYSGVLPHGLAYQGFEDELATLPGKYARPNGCILLAYVGGVAVGCVAMRELLPMPGEIGRSCEMKRLYTRSSARGLGIGRALCERLLEEARGAGYARMKLDTDAELKAAVRLYESLGFVPIARYNDDPMPCTLWMSKELG
ncbi:MAG: GNAT family N-acetyltransferase [Phycisphaeraceae bacterium]|nr:GNAT family N-acetyltransferase [Phycisphaeraceae bacterium]